MASSLSLTSADIAGLVDHSLLQPQLTRADIQRGLSLAASLRTASVCVRPCDVALAVATLRGSGVPVCTVIGFPHGSVTPATKLAEAREALALGAVELDVVINISHAKSGRLQEVEAELEPIAAAAHAAGACVKVIFENAYLSLPEKRAAYAAALRALLSSPVGAAGRDFLKTSTGYASAMPSGSTPADLRHMRDAIAAAGAAHRVGTKAAGGVRTLDALLEAVACGATRIGATATEAMAAEATARILAAGGAPIIVQVEPAQPLEALEEAPAGEAAGVAAGGAY